MDKHSKSKKTLNSEFELFRMRDKNVPIEVLEFSKDSSVLAFGWENKGIRFGIIHTEGQSNRTDVSFYSMGSKYNGKISLLKVAPPPPPAPPLASPSALPPRCLRVAPLV